MKMPVDTSSPYAVIHLEKIPDDISAYRVIKKKGSDIPALFGRFPSGSYYEDEEYLTLKLEHLECSVSTTNPDALERAEIDSLQGEGPRRIAMLTLSQNYEASVPYDEYTMKLSFSVDLKNLCLRFYRDTTGREVPSKNPMDFYDLGLAEIRVG